jgi:hypothetical protein
MSSAYTLPKGFLEGPAPNLKKSKINFTKGNLPEYEGQWAAILDGVLSEEECEQLVAAAEATTDGKWERALVNIGNGMQAMYEDTRKCGRIIWDTKEIMANLWARVEGHVPEIHRLYKQPNITGNGPAMRNEVWNVTRLNERARFLKYVGGEYFKGVCRTRTVLVDSSNSTAHCDGCYETPDHKERSYFTLHLYLNDPEGKDGQEPLEGGATTFYSGNMQERIDVVPKCGRVLMFQHRGLLHSGDDVVSGQKLTMRTDVMFAKEEKTETETEA